MVQIIGYLLVLLHSNCNRPQAILYIDDELLQGQARIGNFERVLQSADAGRQWNGQVQKSRSRQPGDCMRRQDLDVRTDLSLLLHDLFALDRHDAQNVEIGQTMRQLSFARKVVFLASSLAGTNHHITCLFHNFPSNSILDKHCRGTIQLVAPTKKKSTLTSSLQEGFD